MSKELSGSCGCGAVSYIITGPVRVVLNCHCDSCKKNNGTAYSTYCVVAQSDLDIQQGAETIAIYEPQNGGKKHVCSKCGSPLYNAHERYPGMYMIYYGSLSSFTNVAPIFNIYCENKLPWVDGISEIKSFHQAIER